MVVVAETWSPRLIVGCGVAAGLFVVGATAVPIFIAQRHPPAQDFWLSVANVSATTAATIVIGGIAVFQTLANARLHREAEEGRQTEANRRRDDDTRREMRELLAGRHGDRNWRRWVINFHVDNRSLINLQEHCRKQFREIGIDYDEFMRLFPDLKAEIDVAVRRGERAG